MPPCITPYPHLYPNSGNWFHAWHGLYSDEYETEVARKNKPANAIHAAQCHHAKQMDLT